MSDRNGRRPWRIAFVIAAVALTVGTHWPRLEIDLGGVPAPDKMLHAGAFGLMTLLLWMTGWIRTRRALLAIGIGWAIVDEITQGAPGLSRTISVYDAIASSIGILLATALLWCGAPVRARRAGWIVDDRLQRSVSMAVDGPTAMRSILGMGLVGGAGGALIGWLVSWANPLPVEGILLGLGLGALIGSISIIEVRRRRALARLSGRCLECGGSCFVPSGFVPPGFEPPGFEPPGERDDDGWRRCDGCGTWRHVLSEELPPVPTRTVIELLAIAVGLVTAALLVLMMVLGTAIAMWTRSEATRRMSLAWNEMPDGMSFVLDMLWVGLLLAAIGRLLRRRVARRLDSQGERCLKCRHDLRATPTTAWRGRCGECGQEFVRIGDTPVAA